MHRSAAILFCLCGLVGAFVPHAGTFKTPSGVSLMPRMAIVDDINVAMKQAMKDKAKEKLTALRNIRAAFLVAMKEDGSETLPDEKAQAILRKLQKMRLESIELFKKAAGREDMIQAEEADLVVIEAYLPKLADEATTRKWVEEAIAATGATAGKDMGKVMGVIMKDHKADVDGALVRKIATELLSG